ncbi:SAG-related sequence [Besnoitia besnoiti]|uniref:SAG-related sequence n=1 Tax=Besnoitia besnoiti TaxID=94643 RepID=A0A2A9M6E7_BESBE|nr:SAG-related sequence [Besnoitia besnoiti]PFH31456.1 SAG-related sequence [Besnoitia besnoiti]
MEKPEQRSMHQQSARQTVEPGEKSVSTCKGTSSTNDAEPSPASLTFSSTSLTGALRCSGSKNKVVPAEKANVCTERAKSVADCKNGKPPEKQTAIGDLLGLGTKIEAEHKAIEPDIQEWRLTLDKSQLPLADKAFFIGCQYDDNDSQSKCNLAVTVQARLSAVEGNTITCAYGKNSNSAGPLNVELTEEKNSVTVKCGTAGSFRPENHDQFCLPSSPYLEKCTRKMKEILPKFEASWWDIGDDKTSTLTIPRTAFPAEEQQFLVGCVYVDVSKKQEVAHQVEQEEEEQKGPEEESSTTSCGVLVTCLLPKTLKAKASSVVNNVGTCAYGEDSNKAGPLKVEVSPATKKLILDCGKDGSFRPEGLTTFCNTGADKLEECATKGFQDILPSFANDWWVPNEDKTSSTLTIPTSVFPAADQEFLVGCVLNKSSSEGGQKESPPTSDIKTSAFILL